jgi:SAM-dependent methyltransferase
MPEVDRTKLREFMGRMIGYLNGTAACFSIWLGDELGLYAAMADGRPRSADEVASQTGCNPRLVREWLDGQAAARLIEYDAEGDRYSLSPEGAQALAEESSPVFTARGMSGAASWYMDVEKIKAAFRGDGGLAWGDHHPCLFKGTEWTCGPAYRAHLTAEWIPALDGVAEQLESGASVADVGCGHGASVILMARAYPKSQFWGFDLHAPSIESARERASGEGLGDRTRFEVAGAKDYPGTYDLICFFDCLHDMGDPVGIAAYAREHLDPDGTVLLVEPFAIDGRAANLTNNPLATVSYVSSMAVCTPNSLSQEVGLALGAQAGEARLREVFGQAGFTRFRRAAQTTMNIALEARP